MAATVTSRAQAHALFEFWRSDLLDRARSIAVVLCARDGTTHARTVRGELARLQLLHHTMDERWISASFNLDGVFVWTGEWHQPASASLRTRNGGGGGRRIKVWKLCEGVLPTFARDPLVRHPEDDDIVIKGTLKYGKPTDEELKIAADEIETYDAWLTQHWGKGLNPATLKIGRWLRLRIG